MPHLHVYQRAVTLGKRRVLALMRTAQPAASRIGAMLIMESPFQHQYFFTAPVPVRLESRIGLPTHQSHMLALEVMQRHHGQSIHVIPFSSTGWPFLQFAESCQG